MGGDFQNGLCSCCEDCGACAVTYFCPCYVAGKNAEAMNDSCILYGILALTPIEFITNGLTRGKIREKYGIEGSLVGDILAHMCCPCCALIQDKREISAHGDAAPDGLAMARE